MTSSLSAKVNEFKNNFTNLQRPNTKIKLRDTVNFYCFKYNLKWTNKEFSEKIGYSISTIKNTKRGECTPTLQLNLSYVLGMNLTYKDANQFLDHLYTPLNLKIYEHIIYNEILLLLCEEVDISNVGNKINAANEMLEAAEIPPLNLKNEKIYR